MQKTDEQYQNIYSSINMHISSEKERIALKSQIIITLDDETVEFTATAHAKILSEKIA